MKKYKYLKMFFMGIVLFGTGQLFGQGQIAGTIVDDTGEPLIGANVLVQSTTEGTITDFDGTFSFNTTQDFPVTLVVSYTGYTTQELVLDGPRSDLAITLSEGVLIGSDVIISASRKREKVQEAPASVSVLSARALETSPNPTDATRNLVNTAGVQIQQQSANRINISMRGGSGLFGTSVFPIMDYRSLVGPGVGTFQSDQAGIMNLDLNRIEVVRGPGSALYGPGVTQGVVHFITKSPIDFPGTSFEVMAGELSTYGGALRHATKVSDKFGFKINVQHRRGNEFEYDPNNAIDAAYISDMLPDQGQGRGLYRPAVSNGVVSGPGTLLFSFNELDEDNNGNGMQQDWYNTSLNTTLEFRPQDNLNFNFSGGYNSASSLFFNEQGPGLANADEYWMQGRMQAGGLFAQVFYLDNDGGNGDSPTFLYKTGNVSSVARDQLEAQLQYNFETPGFLNADWTAGMDYRFSGQGTENLTYGRNEDDDDFEVIGGYIQGKFGLGEKLDLVLAGRYDQFNFIDDGAFAPRAALVFKASPKHTLRASYNRASSTVSNLQLNIDFPLVTVVPNSFDVWLFGNKNPQTFGNNPTYSWFTGLIPGTIPVGTPGAGLPLAVLTQQEAAPGLTLYDAVLAQLIAGLQANPATATAAPVVQGVLQNIDQSTLGFGGALSPGFNIFDGSPLGLQTAPISEIAITDNLELGYKGLVADKLSVSWDIYYVREDKNSQFTAISPAYRLLGIDGLATDLGAAVQARAQPDIEAALVANGLPADVAAATAAGLGAAINGAYTDGGNLLLNTASPAFGGATLNQVLTALPFHATAQTDGPPSNGVTHLAAGYRTFDARDYFGSDLGLEYYLNDQFTIFGNYSWLSDNTFMQNVIGSPEGSPALPTNLNVPKNKFRLGWRLTPEFGFRAQMGFQHDDAFPTNAGDFSGRAEERNLVDASVGYKFENGLTLDVSASNLFDNEYRYYPNMPVIGRRVIGKLSYTFGAEGPSDLDGDGIADKRDACPTDAGLKEFAGCPDSDGDGIVDKDDKCPLSAGDALYMGCPDSDGDGVIDIEDDCPNNAGDLNGCPDGDGDGVADKDDDCPNAAGPLGGCPDGDGDGVADKDDNCPTISGTVSGCPDGDGDGVADKDDKCPDTAANTTDGCPADADGDGVAGDADRCPNEGGIVDENGCPKDSDGDGIVDNDDKCPEVGGIVGPDGCAKPVPVKAVETFSRALEGVKFHSSRSTLTRASHAIMDEVVAVMAEFPGLKLSIEGHTDSQGGEESNMELSTKRAQSVLQYLVDKGVDPSRLRAVGFGESIPIADNNTAAGRAQNRRVEFRASY